MIEDEESAKRYLGRNPREQGTNIKVRTKFGAVHFTIRHDETSRVTRIDWDTAASEIHETSDIATLLHQFTDGLNKAITAMNEDWSSKWNLADLNKRLEANKQL